MKIADWINITQADIEEGINVKGYEMGHLIQLARLMILSNSEYTWNCRCTRNTSHTCDVYLHLEFKKIQDKIEGRE